jgi:hypothetical protein
MKLIEHIVRNDRPFTEIVTADYIMVSPYTARGYGIFDEVKSQFKTRTIRSNTSRSSSRRWSAAID